MMKIKKLKDFSGLHRWHSQASFQKMVEAESHIIYSELQA